MPDEQIDIDEPDAPSNDPVTHDDSSTDPSSNDSSDSKDDADSSKASKMNDDGMALTLAATSGIVAGLAGIAYVKHRRNEEGL